jgi:uncharacterized protein YigE (DUF2233 family)
MAAHTAGSFFRRIIAMRLLAAACLVLTAPALAAPPPDEGVSFETVTYAGTAIDVVTVDLRKAQLGLFWRDEHGSRLARLHAVRDLLLHRKLRPVAITNAGIFAPRTPSGLHIEEGRHLHALNLAATDGNFGMKPNGVFFLDGTGAAIRESSEFARRGEAGVGLATQSGPLLVRSGGIHPKFSRTSSNALPRSGVGVVSKDRIVLAVTRGPIRFYDFALFFRDRLGCQDALYLDGVISSLWAPALHLDEDAGDFMGMLAVWLPVAPSAR